MTSRYQILGEINQGGVGVVLKAWDTKLQRHVAIKRFRSASREVLGSVAEDLLKEASTLSSMQHPNIVSVYDVDMDGGDGPEVIMEYLNGQDLEQAVAQAALTLEDFYQVAGQTLDALSNAHRMNLLHRDIKPSNIQVTWLVNGKFVSKFVDFGLAKFFARPSKQTVRHDGTVMGSVYYMAPEQFERLPLDHRSDLYSLGCVFYFGLSMHRPFEGESANEVINAHLGGRPARLRDYRPQIPPDLEKWVEWLMSRQPEGRPADAELALSALRQIMAGEHPEAVPGIKKTPLSAPAQHAPGAKVPNAPAFAAGPAVRRTPARRSGSREGMAKVVRRTKKSAAGGSGILLIGGAMVILLAGSLFLFPLGGKKNASARAARRDQTTAGDILNAASREAELSKAKEELAAAQARLAVHQSSPDSTAFTSSAFPADLTRPPAGGLLMWFDAAKGTRADAVGKPADVNGPVGQWRDNATLGGNAVLQYTGSSTKDKQQHYPVLHAAPAGAGLGSSHPVLSFDRAGDTLCVRDKDKVGDPLAASLDGGNVTVLMVFRAAGPDAPEGLLLAQGEKKQKVWSLGVKNKGLVAGPDAAAPLQIAGTETEFRIASFTLDAATGKLHLGLISSDGQKASRDVPFQPDKTAHIDMVRMGTSDAIANPARSVFSGDIAEVLIYNRALDRDTRHHAENYLRLRYFGSSGPTITAKAER